MGSSYEQKSFDDSKRQNRWQLVASPEAADDSLAIHQDARLYLANLSEGARLTHDLVPSRLAWLQVLRGEVRLGDHQLTAGDGASVTDQPQLDLTALGPAEVLLFDLA